MILYLGIEKPRTLNTINIWHWLSVFDLLLFKPFLETSLQPLQVLLATLVWVRHDCRPPQRVVTRDFKKKEKNMKTMEKLQLTIKKMGGNTVPTFPHFSTKIFLISIKARLTFWLHSCLMTAASWGCFHEFYCVLWITLLRNMFQALLKKSYRDNSVNLGTGPINGYNDHSLSSTQMLAFFSGLWAFKMEIVWKKHYSKQSNCP